MDTTELEVLKDNTPLIDTESNSWNESFLRIIFIRLFSVTISDSFLLHT
jgi:hypothetical protein